MALELTRINQNTHWKWVNNGYTFSKVVHIIAELYTLHYLCPQFSNRFITGETL